ncbi:glycosyltransferase family 2 protein [Aridibaculum aurantiacum]|uniref:glycosyltransferase family 2 protein n=1 Tax=Aridibaculum aurantiacum TaxID=2810307 RepID=UPI001A95E1F8|nr:glycosyltransferase family 2 protein [Aridibaculum aurantiacum]
MQDNPDKLATLVVNENFATTSQPVMISVICPVYNEAAYIGGLLDFFVKALPADKELILIDGNSSDDTCGIIKAYKEKNGLDNIHLLHNPDRYVPYALNKAIPASKGNVIVRLDAHTEYSPDYFLRILDTFNKTGADIVGGPMRIANGNAVQNAIGYATSTRFGVGNSSFHFEDFEGFTESVYLGAWKKEMFETTGLFDTVFKRNQDDEFHYRANSMGFKVYQDPSIKLYYHPRKSLKQLYNQYFQYGLFKPLVLKKIKSSINLRHIVPSGFVCYLLLLPFLLLAGVTLALAPLALYVLFALGLALLSKKTFREMILIPAVYFTIHIAYGSGFLAGLVSDPSISANTGKKQLSYPFK